MKEKGYDLISSFNKISTNPILLYALTMKNGKLGLIDSSGNEILKNEYNDIVGIEETKSPFYEYHNHLLLKKGKKWALTNISGKLLSKFEYDFISFEKSKKIDERQFPNNRSISIFKDSIFKAYLDPYGTKYVYLNLKGEKINFLGRQEQMEEEEKQRRSLSNQNKEIRLNIKGNNYNIPKELGEAKPYENHLFEVKKVKNKKYLKGIYDTIQKKIIVPIEYDFFQYTPKVSKENYFIVSKNKKKYFLDASGKKINNLSFKNIREIRGSKTSAFVVTNEEGKKAIFDMNFKPITDFLYRYISHSNTLILGTIDKKYTLLNFKGETIKFNVEYDRIILKTNEYKDIVESFHFMSKDGKLAIIDKEGKLASNFDYEKIIPECYVISGNYSLHEEFNMTANHPNRFIYFKKDGKYGIMDNNYNIILDNDYDMILESIFTHFVYLGKKIGTNSRKNKWGIYNVKDRKLLVPIQFNSWIYRSDSFFVVHKDNKYGVYDKKGDVLLPLEFEERISVEKLYNGLYSFSFYTKGVPFAYKDSSGKVFYIDKNN